MQIKLLIVGYLLSQWTQTQEVKPCQITSHSYGAQAALAQAIRRKHNIVPGRLPSNNSSGLVRIPACICFENILKECVAGSFIFLRQACGCRDKDWSLCSKCNYLLRSMSYWSVGAQSANNGMDYWRSVRLWSVCKEVLFRECVLKNLDLLCWHQVSTRTCSGSYFRNEAVYSHANSSVRLMSTC